jgi:hypothetical protein
VHYLGGDGCHFEWQNIGAGFVDALPCKDDLNFDMKTTFLARFLETEIRTDIVDGNWSMTPESAELRRL